MCQPHDSKPVAEFAKNFGCAISRPKFLADFATAVFILLASLTTFADDADLAPAMEVGVDAMAEFGPPPDAIKALMLPILNAEITLIHHVCQPTEQQSAAIVAAAAATVPTWKRLISNEQPNWQRQFVKQPDDTWLLRIDYHTPEGQKLQEDPRGRIERDAKRLLAECLSPEQCEKYDAECEARQKLQARVVGDQYLMILDNKVGLSDDQRRECREVFDQCRGVPVDWLTVYLMNPTFCPPLPPPVTEILEPKQKKAWDSQQNVMIQHSVRVGPESFVKSWVQ